jgi:triacylglycerol esterase/lipase EstA (alpha/beta hydrolase family)
MANPIILIPGIEATTLVNINSFDFDYLWSKYDTLLNSVGKQIFTYALQTNPSYDADSNTIIERGHIDKFPYQEAISGIQSKVAAPIFLFGYDWRKTSAENGKRLLEFVAYLKNKLNSNPATKVDKFNFVTHSMGGLIFSCYLKQLNGIYDDIDRVAMCACPFRGSVYALVHLAIGNAGVHSIFDPNDASRKANRTFPAVFELCPWYKNAITFENGTIASLSNINNWQSTIYDDVTDLFKNRLLLMQNFQANEMMSLELLPKSLRDKIVLIVGEGEQTHNKVIVKNTSPEGNASNFFDFNQKIGDGDGTVPFESSSFYCESLLTISVKKSIWNISNDMSYHGLFLKDSRIQNIVNRHLLNDTNQQNWWASVGGGERLVNKYINNL